MISSETAEKTEATLTQSPNEMSDIGTSQMRLSELGARNKETK
jgi:hypothetical protein